MKFTKAEIDAVIAASPRTTAPLNKLVLSADHQVRPGGSTSKMSIAELAASILDCGVLQNLIVVKGPRGMFEVCAGGRRLAAGRYGVSGGMSFLGTDLNVGRVWVAWVPGKTSYSRATLL